MTAKRHDLMYLDSQAPFTISTLHADQELIQQQVKVWLGQGLPCIYAKQNGDDDRVNLGLPLFFAGKKHRIGLSVIKSAILRQKPLPQLIEMDDFLQCYYGLDDLRVFVSILPGSVIAVYGSFLFHYLSGQSGINDMSDFDVLIHYHEWSLSTLAAFVNALSSKLQRCIDGEIRFKNVGDIPLKELLDLSANRLLCKNSDGVALISRTELYERYPLL